MYGSRTGVDPILGHIAAELCRAHAAAQKRGASRRGLRRAQTRVDVGEEEEQLFKVHPTKRLAAQARAEPNARALAEELVVLLGDLSRRRADRGRRGDTSGDGSGSTSAQSSGVQLHLAEADQIGPDELIETDELAL